jgi:hypothetical protein
MAETIAVPGFGAQKKTTVYVVGGLAVVVVGIAYYRSKKAAANATPTGPGIDSTINPATGFPYGSAEDAAALSSQAGYITPASGGGGGGSSGTDTTSYTAGGFTSNSQWTQAAETYAAGIGGDQLTVASALGHYLAGVPLTTAEIDLVQQSIAAQGYPPQSGPNGFPPSYRTASAPPPVQAPKPTPKPIPAPVKYDVLHPPKGTKFVADGGNHNVLYEIWPTDGKPRYINMADWIALGSPKYTVVHHLFPKR